MLEELDDSSWGNAFHEAIFRTFGYDTDRDDDAYVDGQVEPVPPGAAVSTKGFGRAHVVRIIGIAEGKNDEAAWIVAGLLADGRWFFLEASCDYTGWDCQAGGHAVVATTKKDILRFGITPSEAQRMGLEGAPDAR